MACNHDLVGQSVVLNDIAAHVHDQTTPGVHIAQLQVVFVLDGDVIGLNVDRALEIVVIAIQDHIAIGGDVGLACNHDLVGQSVVLNDIATGVHDQIASCVDVAQRDVVHIFEGDVLSVGIDWALEVVITIQADTRRQSAAAGYEGGAAIGRDDRASGLGDGTVRAVHHQVAASAQVAQHCAARCVGDADIAPDADAACRPLAEAVGHGQVCAGHQRASGLCQVANVHAAGTGEAASRLCEAAQCGCARIVQRTAALGVSAQYHAAAANVECAIGLCQAALCAETVQADHTRGVHRALRTGFVKRYCHARRNHHIGHVGQIGHCATGPVGGVKPVARIAASPGHRTQACDAAGAVGCQRQCVVAAVVAVGNGRCRGGQCLAGRHVFVGEHQRDVRHGVAGNAQLVAQVSQISRTGGVRRRSVVHTGGRLRCESDHLARDLAGVAREGGTTLQEVVGRIGPLQGDAADREVQVLANVSAVEVP